MACFVTLLQNGVVFGIGQENDYQLSESLNRLIIDGTVGNLVITDLCLEPDRHFNRSTKSNDNVGIS